MLSDTTPALEGTLGMSPQTASKTTAPRNVQAIGLLLASVGTGAIGQLILKAGMNSTGKLQFSLESLVQMASNPLVILGVAVFFISTVLWLFALARADLSFAYPFLSLTYMVVLIGGAVLFHEAVTLPRVLGFAVIVTGVWIVARSEQKSVS